ncbi:MAG: phosphotransferase family protein, partial [Stackebrandtia sp.]
PCPVSSAVMDTEELTSLLMTTGFGGADAVPIRGGWASWTFDVGGEYILRVARNDEIAASHRREVRLLPRLAEVVDFGVPLPLRWGVRRGHRFMVYRKLAGRALKPGDRLEQVVNMLRQLHSFPVPEAAELLGCGAAARDWQNDYMADWGWIEDKVLPCLDSGLRDDVSRRYTRQLAGLAEISPALVHRDLGTEHILSDANTNIPGAIIDFETATVGDPTIDFIGLLITFGPHVTDRLITAYGGETVSWFRLRFYWWMGAVHAIRYGVDESDAEIVADGVSGLRDRLARLAAIEAG